MSRPARLRSTVPRRLLAGLGVFAVTTLAVGTAGVANLSATLATVERAETGTALTKKEEPKATENYLLVGSDTREGADPNSADFGSMGNEGDAPGRRSDTIMVLRFDPKTGNAAILSIPRDLWVPIAGTGDSNRINSAYSKGNDVLIETVEQNLGIPIHHFVDVDFYGFKDLIDALGGVTIYFDLPTRDKNTGLRVPEPGCVTLDGQMSLAYVRSRHFSQEINGRWFAHAQGGMFAPGAPTEIIRQMRASGAPGAGQSSWGPSVYAIVDGDTAARALAMQIRDRYDDRVTVHVGAFPSAGASVSRTS